MTTVHRITVRIPDPEKWADALGGASDPVEQAARILLAGGVALIPTDTVYGLAAHPERPEAIGRIFTLKRRPRSSNLPVLVATKNDPENLWLNVNGAARSLLASPHMPGALTLVLGTLPERTVAWLRERSEAAVRIPNDPTALKLLKRVGPLLATSANAHGRPTPETVDEILDQLDGVPDVVLDVGWIGTVPSTIVNCRTTPPAIEREGAIPESAVRELLR